MGFFNYLIDTNNRPDLVEEIFKRRKYNWRKVSWNQLEENKWDFLWKTTVSFTTRAGERLNIFTWLKRFNHSMTKFRPRMINHFPNPDVITRKTELVKSLQRNFDIIPQTYVLEPGNTSEITKMVNNFSSSKIWILKPEYLHSGKGIEMFDSLDKLTEHLEEEMGSFDSSDSESKSENPKSESKSENPKGFSWVVSQYIDNPFLIDGRKFDIRLNVLVTHNKKGIDIYINPHTFLRTISQKYTPTLTGDFKKDRLVHITNHSVQKYSENFGVLEEGNVMSLDQFQSYLDSTYGKSTFSVLRDFMPRWAEIVIDVILSNRKKLDSKEDSNLHYFELFGFDLLLDEFGRTWLLEVNTNPGLEQDNNWAIHIVRGMLEELAELYIDPVFPPSSKEPAPKFIPPPKKLRWQNKIERQELPEWYKAPNFDYQAKYNKFWNLVYSDTISASKIPHQQEMSKVYHTQKGNRRIPSKVRKWFYPYF